MGIRLIGIEEVLYTGLELHRYGFENREFMASLRFGARKLCFVAPLFGLHVTALLPCNVGLEFEPPCEGGFGFDVDPGDGSFGVVVAFESRLFVFVGFGRRRCG